jgi:hypothetical protein
MPTRKALNPVVSACRTDQRSNYDTFIHASRNLGKGLANLDTGNIGRDRLEFAPDFRGSVWLEVEHVLMGRTTTQENVDYGFVATGRKTHRRTGRFGAVDIGEGEGACPQPQSSYLQKAAAIHAIARFAHWTAEEGKHGISPVTATS